ncbi:hypothetical protein NPIL_152301, partial [Nephila pilipes]
TLTSQVEICYSKSPQHTSKIKHRQVQVIEKKIINERRDTAKHRKNRHFSRQKQTEKAKETREPQDARFQQKTSQAEERLN